MRFHLAPSALLLAAACATNPSPVHVVGTQREMAVLTGEWSGEYSSAEKIGRAHV